MTMTDTRPGRPRGARNKRPTKAAIGECYDLLRDAAERGDTLAAGLLVVNDTIEQHQAREHSDRLRREFESEGGTVDQILDRGRRYLLALVDQIEEDDEPRDAAVVLHKGKVPRDAASPATTGQAGSAAGGNPVPGVSDSRRDLGDEHQTQATQETPQ